MTLAELFKWDSFVITYYVTTEEKLFYYRKHHKKSSWHKTGLWELAPSSGLLKMKTVFLFIWLEYHGSLETKEGDPHSSSYSGPSVCVRIFVRTSRWGGQLTDLAYNLSVMAHKIDIFWIVTSDNWPYVHKSSHIRNLVTLNFKITGFESGHIVKT